MLCYEDGKVLGGHNRMFAFLSVRNIVSDTAMGSGLNSGSCDSAHLIVSEILAHAMLANCCGYTLFADVQTAFASLHGYIALLDTTGSDEIWLHHLDRCGYTRQQATDIM